MDIIKMVREKQPLIHHLTNDVVTNFTANGLLAFGGSPIMAKEISEVAEMASIADGVLLNIGTSLEKDIDAMVLAGITANKKGIPVVLDPVGVAATSFRKKAVQRLLREVSFSAIKGNAGEMAFLVNVPWHTKGVESIDKDMTGLAEIALEISERYCTTAVVTGKIDVTADREHTVVNRLGHEYLTKITGAGCLLGSIITACLAVDAPKLIAVSEAVAFYGQAGEIAATQKGVHGPGTFLPHFLDALAI